jgi:hypothetical protein
MVLLFTDLYRRAITAIIQDELFVLQHIVIEADVVMGLGGMEQPK